MNNITYIFIDGADGVGKTSFLTGLTNKLTKINKKVLVAHIIKYTDHGKIFYQKWVDGAYNDLEGARGMLKATIATIAELDKLTSNYDIVILDRSQASFFAYQLSNKKIREELGTQFDDSLKSVFYTNQNIINIYLHCDPFIARQRMIDGRGKLDYIETKGVSFQQTVIGSYETCFQKHDKLKPDLRINTGIVPANTACEMGFNFLINRLKVIDK